MSILDEPGEVRGWAGGESLTGLMQGFYGMALGVGMGGGRVRDEGQVKTLKELNFWSRERETSYELPHRF